MLVLERPTPDPRTLDDDTRPFAEAVAERYAVKRTIGRGGMGIVYLARDRRLDRHVAIKTLLPQFARDATLRARFVREARAAGGMSHPHIVPIHEAGEMGDHVWFVMALVDGPSLAQRVRDDGPLEPRAAATLLRDVALALAHAHARGLVHRDVKAENILLERATGRALVTDFGIARLAEAAPLTATGQLLGTPHYVSPEQVSGDAVDARSDLYSLGVVGFLALTGRFPFEGELASAVLVAHVTRPAPSVAAHAAHVPPALAAIVERCLAKAPAARFADAESLVAALDAVLDGTVADASGAGSAALPAATASERAALLPGDRPAGGVRLSDAEAQAVWRRAAELQARTGVHARPVVVPRVRDAGRDLARRDGLAVVDVRGAALEAGIGAQWVEHALAEHGLSASGRALRPRALGGWWNAWGAWRGWSARVGSWVAGAPLTIVVAHEVAGGVPAAERERVLGAALNALRDGTATLGTVVGGARVVAHGAPQRAMSDPPHDASPDPSHDARHLASDALRWEGAWTGHRLVATVAASGPRATVRLEQRIHRAALARTGAALALVGGVVGPAVWLVLDVVLRVPAPEWGVRLTAEVISALAAGGGVATALAALPVARALVRRLRRFHAARLHTLGELLALRLGEATRRGRVMGGPPGPDDGAAG